MNCAVFSQKDIDLLQLVLDLPCVAAGEQHEQIERILIELEFFFFGAPPDNFGRFFLPATAAGIEPINNLNSPASRGVNFCASSTATRFTSASSEPTTA